MIKEIWHDNKLTDWRIVPLKRFGLLKGGAGFPIAAQGLSGLEFPFYKVKDLQENDFFLSKTEHYISHETALKLGAFIFPKNTLVFAKVGEAVKLNRYKLLSMSSCIDNNMMGYVIDHNVLSSKYLYYLVNQTFDISYIANPGPVPSVGSRQMGYLEISVPTVKKQRKIAAYLDKTCATIDKVIEAKQKQLEILDDLRKSIIHKAVTRGLDDSVELKDSGVEWIGKMPQHWVIEKLKRLLSQPLMYGTNEAAELDDPEYPRYIRITDFGDSGTLKPEAFKSLPPDKAIGYYLEEGDLLFARSGATVGKTFLFSGYKGLACFAGYLIRARTNKIKLVPKYLYYFSKSHAYFAWKNVIFTQATIQNISATKYDYLPVTVPSVREQQLIVQYLDIKMKALDNMQSNLSEQISTLKQYRKSLIHECVTGKRRITENNARNKS